jgi:peptidoglycan/LPS O-acetylase OafA/YrhL
MIAIRKVDIDMVDIITKNERDNQLDAIKGLAIVLVVTGHIIAFSHPGSVDIIRHKVGK